MAANPRKRQQKLERRAAKRKDKRHELVKTKSLGLAERLAAVDHCPVVDAWIAETLWTEGLGWAVLSRELPNGSVAFALFLIDRYCLGVKNAMADIVGRFTYESNIVGKMKSQYRACAVAPAAVRRLVEEAVAYAHDLGFAPHPDYHKARRLFGEVDPAESTEKFDFGKDGKPFFIAGPNETPLRCRQIMDILRRKLGPDGFDYLATVGPDFKFLPVGDDPSRPRVLAVDEHGGAREMLFDQVETEE